MRDFIKISERPGISAQLGASLVKQQEKLFDLWHRVRDGTLTRNEFQLFALGIRQQIKALLQEAADYSIGTREKTPLAKTVRTCRQLLKVEPALWLASDLYRQRGFLSRGAEGKENTPMCRSQQ